MSHDEQVKGVILAAGYGTRMAALTKNIPKPLLPVVNIPTLEHILLAFRAAGIRDTLIITGYRADAIEAYCGDGGRWNMSIAYQRQTEVSGTGSATRMAAPFVGDHPFMLTYGDILLESPEYSAVVERYRQTGCNAVSALNRMQEVSMGSAVYLEGHRIIKVIEKPPPGAFGTDLNNAGAFLFQPAIFEAIDRTPRSVRGEYELTEAVQTLIAGGADVRGHIIRGQQYDIGTPEAYLRTNLALLENATVDHPVQAAQADNFSSPNVVIETPMVIGRNCELERCRLGPGVCVNEGVRIGHGVSIRHSVVLAGADIGDGASISCAVIGRNANISNRRILHGTPEKVAVVGDNESD